MTDAAFCLQQARELRDRAVRAGSSDEWQACLDLAKAWEARAHVTLTDANVKAVVEHAIAARPAPPRSCRL